MDDSCLTPEAEISVWDDEDEVEMLYDDASQGYLGDAFRAASAALGFGSSSPGSAPVSRLTLPSEAPELRPTSASEAVMIAVVKAKAAAPVDDELEQVRQLALRTISNGLRGGFLRAAIAKVKGVHAKADSRPWAFERVCDLLDAALAAPTALASALVAKHGGKERRVSFALAAQELPAASCAGRVAALLQRSKLGSPKAMSLTPSPSAGGLGRRSRSLPTLSAPPPPPPPGSAAPPSAPPPPTGLAPRSSSLGAARSLSRNRNSPSPFSASQSSPLQASKAAALLPTLPAARRGRSDISGWSVGGNRCPWDLAKGSAF